MVEVQTANEVSRMSIWFSAVFAVVGVGLLYLAIAISGASETVKVLWASGLSLMVAFTFLIIWTMARDAMRVHDRESKRRIIP
jgi:uncharacterized membrane protein YhaH (DUF805 family)